LSNRIPLEVLFAPAEHRAPSLSPDGSLLAYLAPIAGIENLWVAAVGNLATAKPVSDEHARPILTYSWAPNGHLLYLRDEAGEEDWHLFRTDPATNTTIDLTPVPGVSARLIGTSRHRPTEVLVALNSEDPSQHDAYRIDVVTGRRTRLTDVPGASTFGYDQQLRVLAALTVREDGDVDLQTRASEDVGFTTVTTWGMDDVAALDPPLALAADGTVAYAVTATGADKARLVRVDCATGQLLEVLAEDPDYDVHDFSTDPVTGEPSVVTIVRDRTHCVALDSSIEPDLKVLAEVDRGDLTILSRTDDDAAWCVGYSRDDGPRSYFVYRRGTRQAVKLFDGQPALKDYNLAACEPITVATDDGLHLHTYLTFPPGLPRTNLPAVLWVHGGPSARDGWGFDAMAQFLANRGYLCVQVNYRGSTGYGKAFLRAGNREWGARMHTDLLAVTDDLVERGIVDPARIAISGGSYGGYAALAGAAFTPDRFRCAISVCGPSNLLTLLDSLPPYWKAIRRLLHERIGNPATERDFLWSRSPLSRVGDIRIPMLIVQGANDPRVKRAESDQIVAALRDAGIPHEYMVFEDEGHGFGRADNQLRFIAAMERFLAEVMPGDQA